MSIFNPWQNDRLYDFLYEIISFLILFIALSKVFIVLLIPNKVKLRKFVKIVIIDLVIICSVFYIILYWYVAIFIHVIALFIIFHVQKLEAIKTYKLELKGIFSCRIDSKNRETIRSITYDDVIPLNMELTKYLIPKYQIIFLSIILPIIWILLIYIFGNNYFFI